MLAYREAHGRARVAFTSFLDAESHYRSIVASLLRHSTDGVARSVDLGDICVVALFEDNTDMGVVLGNVHGVRRLVVLSRGDMHFDPVLSL